MEPHEHECKAQSQERRQGIAGKATGTNALRMAIRLWFALPNPVNRVQAVEGSRSLLAILTA